MKAWTVEDSSDFDASRQQHIDRLLARVRAHADAPSGEGARKLQRAIASFRGLSDKLKKLKDPDDATVRPENELAYITDDKSGAFIYSLIHEDWRCLYRVDAMRRTCTAIEIQQMPPNLRLVEEDRHRYGRKLIAV